MIIVVDPDRQFRSRVAEQLSRPAGLVELEGLKQLDGVLAERHGEATVLILGPGLQGPHALGAAGRLQLSAPDVSALLVAGSMTSEVLQHALRAGVRDVLPVAFTPKQLLKAVEHAEALSRQFGGHTQTVIDLDQSGSHRVVSVLSSKGGVGKSFIASNLGVILARGGSSVVLVDLDLQFGDLAIMLQLLPSRTIGDVAQDLERVDEQALHGYLTSHRSGVSLLAAPPEPGLAETVSAEVVLPIMRMLRSMFAYVIVDTPSSFNDHVLAAIDESDLVVSATAMDVPSIKNARLALQTLEMLGVERDHIRTVLNRADSKVGLNMGEVEKTLRTKVDVAIPSSRDVPLSINRGAPIALEAPRSPVTFALQDLARSVALPATAKNKSPDPGRFHIGRKR